MKLQMLIDAMTADAGELVQGSADEVRAVAQQGFFDGIRMAAAIVDDPLARAKLWALIRNAPNQSPNTDQNYGGKL